MFAYIVKRMIMGAFTVWAITVLSFIVVQLPPRDAVDRLFDQLMDQGYGGGITESDRSSADELRDYFGLDKPMYIRYLNWIWNMVRHGDLGRSIAYWDDHAHYYSVKEIIGERLWLTVILTSFTIFVTWSMAIPIGIYSAVRQHSVGDYVFTFIGFTGLAVPDFLLGLVLMYVAYAYLGQSVGGLFSADYINAEWSLARVRDLLNHLWIPAMVLGTSGTASLIRIMRNNLLDELDKPYVVTARAKGVTSFKVLVKYPLRVAVNPLISTVGYLLPSLVSGSVIVSLVLSLPTLGPQLLDALIIEDVYLVGFIVFMLGLLTVIGTLISDILLAIVDPRIKMTN